MQEIISILLCKDADNTLVDLREQIFNIPVITDIIFNNLPLSDLHSCSEASKSLCSKTRDYVGRRRTLLLKCTDDISDMQRCLVFLKQNDDYPHEFKIKGVYFVINKAISGKDLYDNFYGEDSSESDGETYEPIDRYEDLIVAIFGELSVLTVVNTIKHLVVKFASTCDGEGLMNKSLLFPLIGHWLQQRTESVTVKGEQGIHWIRKLNDNWYKNIKTIEADTVTGYFFSYDSYDEFLSIKEFNRLLRKWPAIQELKFPVDLNFLVPLDARGKLSAVRSIMIREFKRGWKEMAEKLAKLATPLDILAIDTNNSCNGRPTWNRNLTEVIQILSPCLNNIKKVVIRYNDPAEISNIDLAALAWVKEVHVGFFEYALSDETYEHESIKSQFSQILPNARFIMINREI